MEEDAARFAGAFLVEPLDFEDEAAVFLAAGFLRLEPEGVELLLERLLGFFGVAMATHYSDGTGNGRRYPTA